ncbi:MAG: type II toxin-antitoxin system Phd/YefM family antitoxin [Burkholderiales bacterium]
MTQVNVTELRQNLPSYLDQVQRGEELLVTLRGKVIARIIPERELRDAARERLIALRKKCRIGDVIKPTGERWNAERGRS